MTKYVVVAGGVISGVGKGVTTAVLGKILKEHGYKIALIKIDPYINYDAGTLRPTEHGEVWVTEDGGETDQDLGTYERFMDEDIPKRNNITTGQIYKAVIDKERKGEYLGQTVQFIPHILDEIKQRINEVAHDHEIVIIEIGGTVGDYENVPFLYALKSLEREIGKDHIAYVLVTYLPVPEHIQEMKTKPTQQAIKLLRQEGISPDFIICRSKYSLDSIRRKKIEAYANIAPDRIISEPDIETIYQLPLDLEQEGVGEKILNFFNISSRQQSNWALWHNLVNNIKHPKKKVTIAIVGKYIDSGDYSLTDSYLSIYHALIHAGAALNIGFSIVWIDAKTFEHDTNNLNTLDNYDGVIIPGGFGDSGTEGKMRAIEYVRTHDIPYLGLCYGFQLAVIEFARNVCSMQGAHTTEIDEDTLFPIITLLPIQSNIMKQSNYGGTMRLGAYPALVQQGTKLDKLYQGNRQHDYTSGNKIVLERHRHRYEVNPHYVTQLEQQGLVFSGYHERKDGTKLMEFLELPNHRFFIATQAHPEFKSRLGKPSPIFYGFVQACKDYQQVKKHDEDCYKPSQLRSVDELVL